MSEQLDRWLLHYDSIHRGWTPQGIANGMAATNGFAFPRVAGGYNLYRRAVGAVPPEAARIVGASGSNAAGIATFSWAKAPVLSGQRFELRSVGGGGVESASSDDDVVVQFDALGDPQPLVPNAPHGLSIEQGSGGSFKLTWSYIERRQGAMPDVFKIYSDNGTGQVDYNGAIGEVPYHLGHGRYSFVTGSHVHDTEIAFSVRALTAQGDHDGNTQTAEALADAMSPALPSIVLTEIIEA